jgi:hypothetical protein
MTICVPSDRADEAMRVLRDAGEQPLLIGEIRTGSRGAVVDA